MTVKLFHAVAAILTMLLFFIKQKCALAGVCPAKRRALEECECSSGEPSLTLMAPAQRARRGRAACSLTSSCSQPKYKRDPVISVDNENIGQHPHGRTIRNKLH